MEYPRHRQPQIPMELRLLQLLQFRKSFTSNEQLRFDTLQKGFSGEQKFYQLLQAESLSDPFLFDLLLTSNGTTFQLDSIYLTNDAVTILEIKNYMGDFYIENDKWYIAKSKQEIRNPVDQLKRSEFLLKHLLRKSHPHLTVHSCLVFIHDEFTLYNAPIDLPAILPTQLTKFIKNVHSSQQRIPTNIESIATHLTSLHIRTSPFKKVPTYTYDELRKGVTCPKMCGGFLKKFVGEMFICPNCKETMAKENAIYHAIVEVQFLFPKRTITTGTIQEWCNNIQSLNTIRNILKKNLTQNRKGRYTHYILKK